MLLALAVNSRSGGRLQPDELAARLRSHGAQVGTLSLAELDSPLPSGVERLVIAGGDGSIGVAARAARAAGVPLAVIPGGTANDFARAARLPTDLDRACALAADPAAAARHYEVGMFGSHPFVNAAAAGLSAVASRYAEPHKPRLGSLAYAVGAIRAGASAPSLPCRIRCDGEETLDGRVWQVVVAATGAFGGGSSIGGTRPDDGQLDVAVVPAGPRIRLVRHAWGMRRGVLTAQRDVPHYRADQIEIELPDGTQFNVDGDLRESSPARFSVLEGGVDVVVP